MYQSLDDITSTSSPKKTSALALSSQYKGNETITQSSSTESNHQNVMSMGSISNSCHKVHKGRIKLSCLDILNFFCLMLLTLYLVYMLKVNFEHEATLASFTSLKICCKKCLWSPLSLCTVMTSCKVPKLLDNGQLGSLNGRRSKIYTKLEDVHVKVVES